MKCEWDPVKRVENIAKHGIDFAEVEAGFNWRHALVGEDARKPYGERRFNAAGLLHGRMVVVIFTVRPGPLVRLISARPANRKEVKRYEATFADR